MRNKIIIGTILVVSIVGLLAYNLIELNRSVSVSMVEAVEGAIEESVFASGKLIAAAESVSFLPYSGKIEQVSVEVGDRVAKGDTLLVMSTKEWEEQIQLEENNREATRIEQQRYREQVLEQAKLELQAGKSIHDLLDKHELALFDLRLERSAMAIAALRDKIDNREVKADRDGIVTEVSVIEGQAAAEGTPVIRIIDDQQLQAQAYLNELDAGKVSPDMEALIIGDAFEDSFQGKVTFVAPIAAPADPMSKDPAVEMKIDLMEQSNQLRPGYNATIEIKIQFEPQVLLPLSAVRLSGDEALIYEVVDGIAQSRSVRVGRDDGLQIEIIDGLSAGASVIGELSAEITDGIKVSTHD